MGKHRDTITHHPTTNIFLFYLQQIFNADTMFYLFPSVFNLDSVPVRKQNKNKQQHILHSVLMNVMVGFQPVKWNTSRILNPILTFEFSRGSYLCQHSSCAQQAALTSAEDSGGHPEDGFFISKPPGPESQEVRRQHAETQAVKKTWTPHISYSAPPHM